MFKRILPFIILLSAIVAIPPQFVVGEEALSNYVEITPKLIRFAIVRDGIYRSETIHIRNISNETILLDFMGTLPSNMSSEVGRIWGHFYNLIEPGYTGTTRLELNASRPPPDGYVFTVTLKGYLGEKVLTETFKCVFVNINMNDLEQPHRPKRNDRIKIVKTPKRGGIQEFQGIGWLNIDLVPPNSSSWSVTITAESSMTNQTVFIRIYEYPFDMKNPPYGEEVAKANSTGSVTLTRRRDTLSG